MAEKDDKVAAQNQYEKGMYEKYFIFTRLFHIQSWELQSGSLLI